MDTRAIRQWLHDYPAHIGMHRISDPNVMVYHGKVPEDWGVTGFVVLAESHISVHTFPARQFVWIDVFSCNDFDADAVLDDLKGRFALHDWVAHRHERRLPKMEGLT